MGQMEHWLTDGDVQRLVVVVTGVDSGETLERWQFNVNVEDDDKNKDKGSGSASGGAMDVDDQVTNENDPNNTAPTVGASTGTGAVTAGTKKKKMGQKSIKEVHNEIQAIIRQITASVSLLFLWIYLHL